MSTGDRLPFLTVGPDRVLSIAGIAVLLGTALSVLLHVADVAGDPQALLLVILGALVASTLLARYVSAPVAALVAGGLIVVGANWYFLTLPEGIGVLSRVDVLLRDSLALLSGLSVLQITNAGAWALAITPGPVFLTWYLAIRGRYVLSTVVAGSLLTVFVLTGDAETMTALFGVVGAGTAVGFGDLARRDGSLGEADIVVVVLAAMVAATLTVGVIPAGAGHTFEFTGPSTVEASLTSTDDQIEMQGAISLSPAVRFTVVSDAPDNWVVKTYDRYTGDGWIRTGGTRAYGGSLSPPAGRTRTIEQSFRVESPVGTMPAAWRPTEVSRGAAGTVVTEQGTLDPRGSFDAGDSYAVTSENLISSDQALRTAGRDYPARIRERYLQLPASTPRRVAERTDRLTSTTDTPFDTATVIERWLRNNKQYSLDVDRPSGNTADAFLFEMGAGYCTYYATTMVVMLRTQGIPARLAVGYTSGELVDDNRYVVRGLNSHAWVQVYFPDEGWVRFDPTPPDPRRAEEQSRLREPGEVDATPDVAGTNGTTTGTPGTVTGAGSNGTSVAGSPPAPTPTTNASDPFDTPAAGDGGGPGLPSPDRVALGLLLLAGGVAGLRRVGVTTRVYRELWIRRPPDGPPSHQVTGAYERAEYLQAARTRDRRTGETVRQYLDAVDADDRLRRLGELYERARYAGRASRSDAAEAIDLLGQQVGGRFRG